MEKRSVILIGAGASVEAGVPAAYSLTEHLIKKINDRDEFGSRKGVTEAINFVYEALRLDKIRQSISRRRNGVHADRRIDVEALMRAIDLLATRWSSEVAPFVREWDPTIRLLESTANSSDDPHGIWRALTVGLSRTLGRGSVVTIGRPVERSLTMGHVANRLRTASQIDGRDFLRALGSALSDGSVATNDQMFVNCRNELETALREIVWKDEEANTDSLVTLIESARRSAKVIVASLNYDNCVEIACQRARLSCSVPVDPDQIANDDFADLRLLKLHGSANWLWDEGAIKPIADQEMKGGSLGAFGVDGAMIFGQANKLSAGPPFFDLFLAFRDALTNARQLTVIGYSWRDEHVNTLVHRWLRSSKDNALWVVDPAWDSMGFGGDSFPSVIRSRFGQQIIGRSKALSDAAEEIAFST